MTKQVFKPLGMAAAVAAATLGYAGNAVSAMHEGVASNDLGDLALVPYYTVRGQWVTGIHIVNTSSTMTQVVKFRFRRGTDGMNALDFNLVMPPNDVYAGFLSDDQNGNVSWTSTDTTCTVPATQGNRFTMPPIYRAGADSGYVEIIAMGEAATSEPIAVAAKHSATTSMPLDCVAVRSNFFADGSSAADPGVMDNKQTWQRANADSANSTVQTGGMNTYTDSGNVLKVSYFIRDNATGIEFGDNAVHIEDFLEVPSITNQQYGASAGDLNGLDFPDLNGTGMPRGVPAAEVTRDRFSMLRRADVLGAGSVLNEWSANPLNGVEMDWVLTLPGQYTMLKLPQYTGSLGTDRAWVSTVGSTGGPMANPGCPRTATSTVAECDYRDLPVELTYKAYNREAATTPPSSGGGTLVPGPQPPAPVPVGTFLPKVANVITFGNNSVLGQTDANVNANLGQPFGWVNAELTSQAGVRVCNWNQAQDAGAAPTTPGATAGAALTLTCTSVMGAAPVIGFAAWSRRVATNPNASYGRIVEHSYGN